VIADLVSGLGGVVGASWLFALGLAVTAAASVGPRDDLTSRPGRRAL
jgi:hypothetical protein